ncbi:helix-turn-helix domain-containing protein [Mesobacillus thioparans]|uniref:helix-turn-helix domain-containing protein n=1 Tax=Mesobacillus thioparans TaxID=370439 RepID=UPI0039EED38B
MLIGEKIRQLRIHKKMTQDQLVMGISSVTYLSRIENGKIKPSKSFLEKISRRLNITINDLLNENFSEKEEKIIQLIDEYKTSKYISEDDFTFINMSSKEPHKTHIIVQIFTFLISFHIDKKDISKAKEIYEISKNVIPDRFDYEYNEVFTAYFISCGTLFYLYQTYSEADRFFTRAEGLINQEDTLPNAKLYYNLSLVKQRILKNKTLSLYYSKKAYEIFLKLKDSENLGKVLITRGVQFHLIKDYKKSLEHLLEAKKYIDTEKDRHLNAMIEYNLGRVYQGLREIDKSISHFKESIKINTLLNLDEEKVYSLKTLIEIYQERKQWDTVHSLLLEAIEIAERKNLNYVLLELKAMKAKGDFIRKDYYTYEKEMQQIIDKGIELKQDFIVNKLATELANHFYDIRAYKKAADYYKIALTLEDKLSSVNIAHI